MPSQPYGECRYPWVFDMSARLPRTVDSSLWRTQLWQMAVSRARFAPGHERVPGAQSMARPEAIASPPAAGFGKQPVGWARTWSQPDAGPETGRAGSKCQVQAP